MNNREVYIGNGEYKNVQVSQQITYILDFNKLGEIIENNPDKEISVGATGDWYFTAKTITKDEYEKIKDLYSGNTILMSSCWSRFSVEIDGESQDITIEIQNNIYDIIAREQFKRGINKIEFWINGLFTKYIKNMDYECIKEIEEKIQKILKKYDKKLNNNNQ